jgi:hypothetical protein
MLPYPQPIADNAIDLTPAPPEFQQSFSDTVGDAGTNTDGFDSVFLQVATDLSGFDNLHSGLDSDLLNIGSAFGDLGTPWEQDFGNTLTNTIAQGQGDFNQFNVDLTGNTPPAPAPAPSTVDCGSGTLDLGGVGQNVLPCKFPLTYTNNTAAADSVLGIRFANDTAHVFDASPTSFGPLAVGASQQITFTINHVPVGDYTIQMVLTSANEVQPFVICLHVNVVPGNVPACPGLAGQGPAPGPGQPGGGGPRSLK